MSFMSYKKITLEDQAKTQLKSSQLGYLTGSLDYFDYLIIRLRAYFLWTNGKAWVLVV